MILKGPQIIYITYLPAYLYDTSNPIFQEILLTHSLIDSTPYTKVWTSNYQSINTTYLRNWRVLEWDI